MPDVLSILFPITRCLACAGELTGSGWLCPECKESLKESKLKNSLIKSGVYGALSYDGAAGELIKKLKFLNSRMAAVPLAQEMINVIHNENLVFDALIPVPISRKRQAKRGYNQSKVLCRYISKETGYIVCNKNCLTKITDTKEQTSLSLHERQINVRGAYKAKNVRGLKLLLIDDVYTTGATSGECAKTLLEAGAKSVTILCAAFVHV